MALNRLDQAIEFLMDETGPTLKYLTASQLKGDEKLARQLRPAWRADLTEPWLARFKPGLRIHGGNDDTFETVTGKLGELGVQRDHVPISRVMNTYLKRLESRPTNMLENLLQIIIGSAAARLGFDVSSYASRRLSTLHTAIRDFDFEIYKPESSYSLPKRYKHYPVVKEKFAENGVFKLPYVHDLYLLSNTKLSGTNVRKYQDVVRYVLDKRYQALPHGFGYVEERLKGKSAWYVIGWKADFDGSLIRTELGSRLPHPFRSKFKLDDYEDQVGWLFPKEWLQDKSPGYWVAGQRMALTPAPRRAQALKLESTFRAARLVSTV